MRALAVISACVCSLSLAQTAPAPRAEEKTARKSVRPALDAGLSPLADAGLKASDAGAAKAGDAGLKAGDAGAKEGMKPGDLTAPKAKDGGATLAVAAPDKKTERTWKSKCGSCHGEDGKAATDKGRKMKVADMTTAEYQKRFTDEQLKKAINDGVKEEKDGVKKEMDGYKSELKEDQVDALVRYIRWAGRGAQPPK